MSAGGVSCYGVTPSKLQYNCLDLAHSPTKIHLDILWPFSDVLINFGNEVIGHVTQ